MSGPAGPQETERPGYRFGPRDRRGLVSGLRPGQVAVALVTLATALGVLRAVPGPASAVLAVSVLAAGTLGCTVPIAGRSLDEWLPVSAAFAWRSRTSASTTRTVPPARRGGRQPVPLRGLAIVPAGDTAGAVEDGRRGTWTGALSMAADGFGMLSAAERARRVASWSSLLAALAQGSHTVERLTWIERTSPDSCADLLRHADLATSGPARPSYLSLVEATGRGALGHELLLACTVSARRPPDERGRAVAPTVRLALELERLAERCRSAGIAVEGALDPAALARVICSVTGASSPGWPWPVSCREEWSAFRTDDSWHCSYWVAEWPRSEVGDDFLLPLLVGSFARRSVALVMAPRPPLRAVKATEHARTEQAADLELRRRHGFAVTARLRGEQAAVEQRARELAAGHAAYRFAGYVTVTAADREGLGSACLAVEQAAALSRLELRRLYGSQAEGFCCTLPTGRGCG